MKTYLSQLLEDIQNAHNTDKEISKKREEYSFEEEMEAIEDYATGRNIPPNLSERCGLMIEQFPPAEKLSEEEMETIIDAFHAMLTSWHIAADFPEGLPTHRAYPLLINLLNEEAWFLPGGTLHYDFCDGYAPECPLEEYCPCKEIWKQHENDN